MIGLILENVLHLPFWLHKFARLFIIILQRISGEGKIQTYDLAINYQSFTS